MNGTPDHYVGDMTIGTDLRGRFTFYNVKTNDQWYAYGKMDSPGVHAVTLAKSVRVGENGTTLNVGDLAVVNGNTFSGAVWLSDGKAVPPGTWVVVGRENASDAQTVVVDAEGNFQIDNIPPEKVVLAGR